MMIKNIIIKKKLQLFLFLLFHYKKIIKNKYNNKQTKHNVDCCSPFVAFISRAIVTVLNSHSKVDTSKVV